jgi:hypothetical protein
VARTQGAQFPDHGFVDFQFQATVQPTQQRHHPLARTATAHVAHSDFTAGKILSQPWLGAFFTFNVLALTFSGDLDDERWSCNSAMPHAAQGIPNRCCAKGELLGVVPLHAGEQQA